MKPFCCICGKEDHQLVTHLLEEHDMSVFDYLSEYSSAPVLSDELKTGLSAELLKSQERDILPERGRKAHKIGDWELEGYSEPSRPAHRKDASYKFPPETEFLINGIKHGDKCLLAGPTGCGTRRRSKRLYRKE